MTTVQKTNSGWATAQKQIPPPLPKDIYIYIWNEHDVRYEQHNQAHQHQVIPEGRGQNLG